MQQRSESAEALPQVQQERDFYARLLGLGAIEDVQALLEDALDHALALTGARLGYLSVCEPEDPLELPRWWTARGGGPEQVQQARAQLSTGVIAEALAQDQPIVTASASRDPRFRRRRSVRDKRIEEVLCVPVRSALGRGVLYLQGRDPAGPFAEEDPTRMQALARHLSPFLERLQLRAQRTDTDPTAPLRARLELDALVGRSPAMATLMRQLELVVRHDIPVLILGPSGSGKTAIARLIHQNSPRARGPFEALNCAALPEGLVESELFGAERGAHATATRRMPGKVEAAQGGTLLLDEIGELPLSSQAKLLKLVDEGVYHPLGSPQARRADLRVLAATHVDLQAAIAERRFREDLYYRLCVLPLRVPGLDERREDIPLLAEHLLQQAVARMGLGPISLSPGAALALQEADWPGNVRQLRHAVEAGLLRASGAQAEQLDPAHLFPEQEADAPASGSWHEETRRFQRRLLLERLDSHDWNVSAAARSLHMSRSQLHHLISTLGLRRPA